MFLLENDKVSVPLYHIIGKRGMTLLLVHFFFYLYPDSREGAMAECWAQPYKTGVHNTQPIDSSVK